MGCDDYGKNCTICELEVNLDFLQLDNDSSTRVVNVDRDQFRDRFFSGLRKVLIPLCRQVLSEINRKNFKFGKIFLETKYLVMGTILLSSPISAELFFLIEQAKKFQVKIFIGWIGERSFGITQVFHQKLVKPS